MVDLETRIKYYKKENERLFKLMLKENINKQIFLKTINEHEAVIRELEYIKNN